MGVLYGVYRVAPALCEKIRANHEVLVTLETRHDHQPSEIGETEWPPSLELDKSWEDILALFGAAGFHEERAMALEGWERFTVRGIEVRLADPEKVKLGAPYLAGLPLDEIGQRAIDSGRCDWDTAEYAASHLEAFVPFWKQAAERGEAIVLCCS